MSTSREQVLSLHKYFIRANRMRCDFDEFLAQGKTAAEIMDNLDATNYLLLWYGALYVVVEGWQHLKLSDEKIDAILKSENVSLLKGVRHDTFHYQEAYDPPRTIRFLTTETVVVWVRTLNRELGRYFLEWIDGEKKKEPPPEAS